MYESAVFLVVAGFFRLADVVAGNNEFRKCYNTSIEMHCFAVQYDDNNITLNTTNDIARQRCNSLGSHVITIKDEETNNIVRRYISDPSFPIGNTSIIWTDAYRIIDYNNTRIWHWVNSSLPNLPDSALSPAQDNRYYLASLEFRSQDGRAHFYLTPQQPYVQNSYVCEYPISKCSSSGSNVLQLADRCYIAVTASVNWFEARNRCFKDGGDLASFADVADFTSSKFTSWLGSDPNVRFWIGLRFNWYIWKDSGEDVKFTDWTAEIFSLRSSLCVVLHENSWIRKNCTSQDVHVVCHTVTSLTTTVTTTISTVATSTKTTTVVTSTISAATTKSANGQNLTSDSPGKSDGALGIGLGVGLGVGLLLVMCIILIVVLMVKRKRSGSHPEQSSELVGYDNLSSNSN